MPSDRPAHLAWPARRLPQVHRADGVDPHPPPRRGQASHQAGPRAGRQGLLLPRQPPLPAATRHQGRHPDQERPGRPPRQSRLQGRSACRSSTGRPTRNATPSNAASASSASSARSPPVTTREKPSTRAPSTSPRSASGSDTPSHDHGIRPSGGGPASGRRGSPARRQGRGAAGRT